MEWDSLQVRSSLRESAVISVHTTLLEESRNEEDTALAEHYGRARDGAF